MSDYSPYQKKVIDRYYDRRDQILLARLGEIVSDLLLADSPAQSKRLWTRAETALKGLKVAPSLIERIVQEQKPDTLAHFVRDLLKASGKMAK